MLRMEYFRNNFVLPLFFNNDNIKKIKVLDVGSLDVNGSYKSLFSDSTFDYQGLDVIHGSNVNIVPENIYNWREISDNTYDIIISGQCFEHVEFPWILFGEICRCLKNNSLMCIITPRLQGRHRYPVDTFRYDVDGYIALCKYWNMIPIHVSFNEAPLNASLEWYSSLGDCMLIAKKPNEWNGSIDISNYKFKNFPVDILNSNFLPQNYHPAFLADRINKLSK